MAAKPWKLILLLAGIFIAGGVTGGFVTQWVNKGAPGRRPRPEQWAPDQLKRLTERLDLKPDQVEELRPIIHRNMEEIGRLRNYSMKETRTIYERMEREISDKLTSEQREKFDQLNKELHERARKFMQDGPNRGSGPGGPRPAGEPGQPPGPPPTPGPAPADGKPPGV